MELKFVELNTDSIIQMNKVCEEVEEFIRAYENMDDENLIEEFWDVVQSMMGIIDLRGLSKEELIQGLDKHYKKLEGRGHKFK